METISATACLAALAQPTRLDAFRLLVRHEPTGLPAGELARLLGVPQNTLSAHLNILTHARLTKSERRGRQIVYRAELGRLSELALFLADDCCGGRSDVCAPLIAKIPSHDTNPKATPMTDRKYNVLFLCTGNSARSILAESIMRRNGAARFNAFSAGSQPKGEVNPLALKVLESLDYPIDGLRSKSWDEFAAANSPNMDFVFTVCDSAAGEACPVWPGQPMMAHWGIEDPAAVEGSKLEKERAFVLAFKYLKNRIDLFTATPIERLDRLALSARLRAIGEIEGATAPRQNVAE